MGQKVYRTKSQKAASKRALKARRKKKSKRDKRSHAAPIFILGIGFSALGLAQTFRPVPFYSTGGLGRYGNDKITASYDLDSSRGFGVFFTLLGILFLYWGYCAIRNSKRKHSESPDH